MEQHANSAWTTARDNSASSWYAFLDICISTFFTSFISSSANFQSSERNWGNQCKYTGELVYVDSHKPWDGECKTPLKVLPKAEKACWIWILFQKWFDLRNLLSWEERRPSWGKSTTIRTEYAFHSEYHFFMLLGWSTTDSLLMAQPCLIKELHSIKERGHFVSNKQCTRFLQAIRTVKASTGQSTQKQATKQQGRLGAPMEEHQSAIFQNCSYIL